MPVTCTLSHACVKLFPGAAPREVSSYSELHKRQRIKDGFAWLSANWNVHRICCTEVKWDLSSDSTETGTRETFLCSECLLQSVPMHSRGPSAVYPWLAYAPICRHTANPVWCLTIPLGPGRVARWMVMMVFWWSAASCCCYCYVRETLCWGHMFEHGTSLLAHWQTRK